MLAETEIRHSNSKFKHPTVDSAVEEIFGGPTKRVLVVHDVESNKVKKEEKSDII